jgi:hypothetical protein
MSMVAKNDAQIAQEITQGIASVEHHRIVTGDEQPPRLVPQPPGPQAAAGQRGVFFDV